MTHTLNVLGNTFVLLAIIGSQVLHQYCAGCFVTTLVAQSAPLARSQRASSARSWSKRLPRMLVVKRQLHLIVVKASAPHARGHSVGSTCLWSKRRLHMLVVKPALMSFSLIAVQLYFVHVLTCAGRKYYSSRLNSAFLRRPCQNVLHLRLRLQH